MSVVVALFPAKLAVTVTEVCAVTAVCVTLNVALDLPAGIVTEAGVEAAALLVVSVTTTPPAGAGPVSFTVPLTAVVELPFTVVGETDTDSSVGGWMVKLAC